MSRRLPVVRRAPYHRAWQRLARYLLAWGQALRSTSVTHTTA